MKVFYKVLILFIFLLFSKEIVNGNSFGILGDVENYVITVNPQKDGSIDMIYNISLKVTGENVDKVKVRLPHGTPTISYYDKNCISDINFSYRQANISLRKSYTNGSNIKFNFSINMKNVYRHNEKKGILIYRIMIGEIKDFFTNEIIVNWAKNGVYFQGRGLEEENYYVWRQKYSLLRSFQVMIQYKDEKFILNNSGRKFGFEEYFYNYFLITVGSFVIILEIRKNILNRQAAKFPFRTKNIV